MKKLYCLTVRCYSGDEFENSEETLKPRYSYSKEELELLELEINDFFEKKLKKDQTLNIKISEINLNDIKTPSFKNLRADILNFMKY